MPLIAPETKLIYVTPTISTSAYSADNQIGSLMTLSAAAPDSAFGCTVQAVSILDNSKQKQTIDCFFYSSSPTVTSTDRTAANVTYANATSKFCGVIRVSSYYDMANTSTGTSSGTALPLVPASNVDLYCLAVIRGAATYGTTTSLQFCFHLLQDRRG